MFRFFRTLRQRLLTENRFSKYRLNAQGEAATVVAPVLITPEVWGGLQALHYMNGA